MQVLLSWLYSPPVIAAGPKPPEDPPAAIGTWRIDEMREALTTGDVSILHRKAFPRLAAQLQKQPHELCCQQNTLPAVEGGVLAYLGTLMAVHPTNAPVHYMSLRLIFCCLHSLAPQQLSCIASSVINAVQTFSSPSADAGAGKRDKITINEHGALIGRTMMAGGGNSNVSSRRGGAENGSEATDLAPSAHVVQEINLMATAILCKLSFVVSLPPALSEHCARQLLEIAKGNENPKLKRIEEEAAIQEIRARVAAQQKLKQQQQNSQHNNIQQEHAAAAVRAEIEIYFMNRNREMRAVLAKIVPDAIAAIHSASERFAPAEELIGFDDEGGFETDESVSALFRPKMGEVTKRALFDSHSCLWIAVLEAVGEDILVTQRNEAQMAVLSVANDNTRSQIARMGVGSLTLGAQTSIASPGNTINGVAHTPYSSCGGGYGYSVLSNSSVSEGRDWSQQQLQPLATLRCFSKDTFLFGTSSFVHVAQFLRLGFKGLWLKPSDDHIAALHTIYCRSVQTLFPRAEGGGTTTFNSGGSLRPEQHLFDELVVAILGALEYSIPLSGMATSSNYLSSSAATASSPRLLTNTKLICELIELILVHRTEQLTQLCRDTVEGTAFSSSASSSTGTVVVGRLETIVIPFVAKSSQIAHLSTNVLAGLIRAACATVSNFISPHSSSVNPKRNTLSNNNFGGAVSSNNNPSLLGTKKDELAAMSIVKEHPSDFLRSLVLLQCKDAVRYSLTLQETLETLWVSLHSRTRTPTPETDTITKMLADHYVFSAFVLCRRVPELLMVHYSPDVRLQTSSVPQTTTAPQATSAEKSPNNSSSFNLSARRSVPAAQMFGTEVISVHDLSTKESKTANSGVDHRTGINVTEEESVADIFMDFMSRLLYLEPYVTLLLSRPFNLPEVSTLITSLRGGGLDHDRLAVPTQTPTPNPQQLASPLRLQLESVDSITVDNAIVVLDNLSRTVKMLKMIVIGAEKGPRPLSPSTSAFADSESPSHSGGGILSTIAWGLVSAIGSGVTTATSAVASAALNSATAVANSGKILSAAETAAIHPLLVNKPMSQQLYISVSSTAILLQKWLVTRPITKANEKITASLLQTLATIYHSSTPASECQNIAASLMLNKACPGVDSFASHFNKKFVLDTLLDREISSKKGLFDGTALTCLQAATELSVIDEVRLHRYLVNISVQQQQQQQHVATEPPRCRLLEVCLLSVDHLKNIAALWARHVGYVYNNRHSSVIEAMLNTPTTMSSASDERRLSSGQTQPKSSVTSRNAADPTPIQSLSASPSSSLTPFAAASLTPSPPLPSALTVLLSRADVRVAAASAPSIGDAERAAYLDLKNRLWLDAVRVSDVHLSNKTAAHRRRSQNIGALFAGEDLFLEVLSYIPEMELSTNPNELVTASQFMKKLSANA